MRVRIIIITKRGTLSAADPPDLRIPLSAAAMVTGRSIAVALSLWMIMIMDGVNGLHHAHHYPRRALLPANTMGRGFAVSCLRPKGGASELRCKDERSIIQEVRSSSKKMSPIEYYLSKHGPEGEEAGSKRIGTHGIYAKSLDKSSQARDISTTTLAVALRTTFLPGMHSLEYIAVDISKI